jgi:hypothetical protein
MTVTLSPALILQVLAFFANIFFAFCLTSIVRKILPDGQGGSRIDRHWPVLGTSIGSGVVMALAGAWLVGSGVHSVSEAGQIALSGAVAGVSAFGVANGWQWLTSKLPPGVVLPADLKVALHLPATQPSAPEPDRDPPKASADPQIEVTGPEPGKPNPA